MQITPKPDIIRSMASLAEKILGIGKPPETGKLSLWQRILQGASETEEEEEQAHNK